MGITSETAAILAREAELENDQSELIEGDDPTIPTPPSPAEMSNDATASTTPSAPVDTAPPTTTDEASNTFVQAKPDLSNQDAADLLPKLLSFFQNNREQLARALGIHRSSVDRWLNGKSRPNNSTLLRMRRLAQERDIH
jgi:DNA-binding transcriptional regulator YiaG